MSKQLLLKQSALKKLSITLLSSLALMAGQAFAINVDEVIDASFENTGGIESWSKLKGLKMSIQGIQGPMKFPMEVVQLDDGRTYTQISVQGKTLKQNVYDGSTLWNTNFMTMKAEKQSAEAIANMKLTANDFPSDLLNYKKKGYQAELMGTEEMDGSEVYKIKLTKEPITVDGKKVDTVVYYYFDTESMVPLVMENEVKQGQGKGMVMLTKFSDYTEVNGFYFPFSMAQSQKGGQQLFSMEVDKIELNPTVEASAFAFPE